MKSELKKYLTLGAAITTSAFFVSCDGEDGAPGAAGAAGKDGAPGAAGAAGTDGAVTDLPVAAPTAGMFNLANLEMTIETDTTNTLTLGEEISIDFDSVLTDSGILFADLAQGNVGTNGAQGNQVNAQITGAATTGAAGTTFGFAALNYDGDTFRNQGPVDGSGLNGLIVPNPLGGSTSDFETALFTNAEYTVLFAQGKSLSGTFTANAQLTQLATTTGSASNAVFLAGAFSNFSVTAPLTNTEVTLIELNSTSNNVTIQAGSLSYPLGDDEIAVRIQTGIPAVESVAIIKVGDLGLGGGGNVPYTGVAGQFDNTADFVDLRGPLASTMPANPTVVANGGSITAPTAGSPVWYVFTTTVSGGITGSFRFDANSSAGDGRPDNINP